MDPEPKSLLNLSIQLINPDWTSNLGIIVVLVLLIMLMLFISTVTSAAENAFFSLTPSEVHDLKGDEKKSAIFALRLLKGPEDDFTGKTLLASILVVNNFTNIFVVISSSLLFSYVFQFENYPLFGFLFEVVFITFLIVLVSEVTPKIYATQNAVFVVHKTSIPLYYAQKILKPFVWVLTKSSAFVDRNFEKKQQSVSLAELNHAIEITSHEAQAEEKNILKSLVNFGNLSVKQIMKSRLDVMAFEQNTSMDEVLEKVKEWRYSRIPVYEESFDSITGILYIKDLLTYINETGGKDWNSIIRPAFFVPEFKKIDDLLNEFKERKIHMAIVIDEYGGTLGIVTLEDVLEEIFGEIKDEFDEDEVSYSKLDNTNYIFEGKISINDFLKVLDMELGYFDAIKGEADTLAGLVMEITQDIPALGTVVNFDNFTFKVESADRRKLKRIKVTIHTPKEGS